MKQKIIDFIESLDFGTPSVDDAFNAIQEAAETSKGDEAKSLIHMAVQFLWEDTSWLNENISQEDKEMLKSVYESLES